MTSNAALERLVLNFGTTRAIRQRGTTETARLEAPWVVQLILSLRGKQSAGDSVFEGTLPGYQCAMRVVLEALGMKQVYFTAHSLKRGAATDLSSYLRIVCYRV